MLKHQFDILTKMVFETQNHFFYIGANNWDKILWASAKFIDFSTFPYSFFLFFFIGLFPTFLMCGKLKFLAFSCAANLASVVSNEVDQILKKKCFSLLHNHYGPTCLFHNIDPFNVSNLCVKRNHTASWDLNITVIKFAIKMNYNTSLNDIFLFLYSLKNKNFCG